MVLAMIAIDVMPGVHSRLAIAKIRGMKGRPWNEVEKLPVVRGELLDSYGRQSVWYQIDPVPDGHILSCAERVVSRLDTRKPLASRALEWLRPSLVVGVNKQGTITHAVDELEIMLWTSFE